MRSAQALFGASAVTLGAVTLTWHGSDLWQHVSPLGATFGTTVAWGLTLVQVSAGLCMLHPRTARVASIVLGGIYALFSLACIPGMIRSPTTYARYGDFFEQFSVVCGAVAVIAANETNAARSAALGRAARVGLGLCAFSFAAAQLVYLPYTTRLVPAWIPPNQIFWAISTTLAFALAAATMLLNRRAPLAIRLMALMMALFGVLVWIPMVVAQPQALPNWSELAETFLIVGAAWLVACVRPWTPA